MKKTLQNYKYFSQEIKTIIYNNHFNISNL